jgi:lipopolysaccharide biosynthesis glycosyltransferase
MIKVFVGADRSQLFAVAVLDHSIRRHTREIVRVAPLIDLDLPEPKDIRQGSRTNFSFARFAIPELCGYRGKAIYLDADMLVFRDIARLWNLPVDDKTMLIQDDVPDYAQEAKAGAPKTRVKQSAVMLINCERARWDVREIVAGLDGTYTYEQLMYEFCFLPEAEIGFRVPFQWNSLEHYDVHTCLLHYTDMNTQPWVSPDNPNGRWWFDEVALMMQAGLVTTRDLNREVELGFFRPSALLELQERPHVRGFDAEAARRYAEVDAKAGFVKHAEVYARKRAREKRMKSAA